MTSIFGRNVNDVYFEAMHRFAHPANTRSYPSRNGPMLELPGVVVSKYYKPKERVLFDAARDCNPFLHFFESLWMLAGRNDLPFMTRLAKNFADFSDDGETLHGAYGHRWRQHFDIDQLDDAVAILDKDPMSRQVVTQMWDPVTDLGRKGKDVPCNTSVMWKLRDGILDMTVTNRSNDAIWGCYGANAVHFSFLHEYIAGRLGVKVGTYYQVSNSLHIYPEFPVTQRVMANLPEHKACPYTTGEVVPFSLFWGGATAEDFEHDLDLFMVAVDEDLIGFMYSTAFFTEVVWPMWEVFKAHKRRDPSNAKTLTARISAPDWQKAVREWLARRAAA